MDGDALDDLLEAKAAHIETRATKTPPRSRGIRSKATPTRSSRWPWTCFLHPKFSAEKLELAQQQEATGIVRRNDDEGGIAKRESAKLVYGANSPYTRQPELATIGAVPWTI